MELIIALIVIGLGVAIYFSFKKKETEVAEPVAEYKVEDPVAPVVAEPEPAVVAVVEGAGEVAVPAKKTRKPRAPKAENPAVKKAPAKAKAPKAAAKKPAARTAKSKKA